MTVAAFATPVAAAVLAFAGSVVGQWWARRSAKELDHWRRREETMRLLRWAVELIVDENALKSDAGVATLVALSSSELLQPEDKQLLVALTNTLVETEVSTYDESDTASPTQYAEVSGASEVSEAADV
ncbi:hypothetical protein ACSMXN_17340 [Jatrophihabitans sp. DSM 45814]